MRLFIPRTTIRRLMIVVAIVGSVAAFETGRRRRDTLLEEAEFHAIMEESDRSCSIVLGSAGERCRAQSIQYRNRAVISNNDEMRKFLEQVALDWDARADEMDRMKKAQLAVANYHTRLREKYSKASLRPWISVAPDLPLPEEPVPVPGPNNKPFPPAVPYEPK